MRPFEELLREGILADQFGGDIKPHGDHAMGFVAFSEDPAQEFTGHVVDIGSGAGLPALVLAEAFPKTTWSLIERRVGRTDLLRRAVKRLELVDRVEVVSEDVTVAARSALRRSARWVTARSFGSPGDTAECAAPFLVDGGALLTSEPFDGDLSARWPSEGLKRVDLRPSNEWRTNDGRYASFTKGALPIEEIPRRGSRKKSLF